VTLGALERKGPGERVDQIIAILHTSDAGGRTTDLIRWHGVSRNTFYKWKAKYGGLNVDEAKRLRELEDENRRLKSIVADQALNLQAV
jgi:putative transposase